MSYLQLRNDHNDARGPCFDAAFLRASVMVCMLFHFGKAIVNGPIHKLG